MVGQIRQPHFPQRQNALMQPSHRLIVAVQAVAPKHLFDPDIQSFQCVQPRLNNFILWVSHSFSPFSSKPDKFRFIYPDYTSFFSVGTGVCLQCVGISPLYFPGSGLPVRGRAPRWGCLSAARKARKTTKGGVFPLLVESTPPVQGCICFFLFSALVPVGSHRWCKKSYGSYLLLWWMVLLLPGPHSGEQLFPTAGGLADGGGNTASPR